MSNILDYIDWRGDLSLDASPFCEVDNLILTQLSFAYLEGIADGMNRRESVTLREAAGRYFADPDRRSKSMGALVPDEVPELLRRAAKSPRFGDMRLARFESMMDKTVQTQFAALCILLGDGSFYVSYRGTDDSLIGWKEDLNMGFMEQVPAQEHARKYLEDAAKNLRGAIRIGGHSKGGNLAIYAAAHASHRVQKRILCVYNNDGPGFSRRIMQSDGYSAIRDRILTIVPQFSVVGLLLEHGEVDRVVKSTGSGLWQHDPFTWQLVGREFLRAEGLSPESRRVEKALRAWVAEMNCEQRRDLVEALYKAFTVNNAETLSDIAADKLDFIKSLGKLDDKTRDVIFSMGKLLLREGMRVAREERSPQKKTVRKAAKGLPPPPDKGVKK